MFELSFYTAHSSRVQTVSPIHSPTPTLIFMALQKSYEIAALINRQTHLRFECNCRIYFYPIDKMDIKSIFFKVMHIAFTSYLSSSVDVFSNDAIGAGPSGLCFCFRGGNTFLLSIINVFALLHMQANFFGFNMAKFSDQLSHRKFISFYLCIIFGLIASRPLGAEKH